MEFIIENWAVLLLGFYGIFESGCESHTYKNRQSNIWISGYSHNSNNWRS